MCDCVIAICSPARPPPVLDLRTIMDMEANSLTLGATPKSPGRYETAAVYIPTEKVIYSGHSDWAIGNSDGNLVMTNCYRITHVLIYKMWCFLLSYCPAWRRAAPPLQWTVLIHLLISANISEHIFFLLPAVSAPALSTPLFLLNCPRSRGRC